jgi:alkylhydroperoxidase/carboxymuconolactone decarboxylase family protein YurZ
MYASAPDDELHFQQFLSANCFGDHVARAGIDLRVRELLTFALLASLGGCDPQVRAHVAANLNVGNGRPELIGVITAVLPFIGYPRALNALAAVNEVAPAPAVKLAPPAEMPRPVYSMTSQQPRRVKARRWCNPPRPPGSDRSSRARSPTR